MLNTSVGILFKIEHNPKYQKDKGRIGYGHWDTDGYFGNPFEIGKDGTREEAIKKFREYFNKRIHDDPEYKQRILDLKGKHLGCFCKPLACHGDVIVEWLEQQ